MTWNRPLPAPDNVTKTYWEATTRGELLYQRCPSCGHKQFYPRAMCTACAGDTEWVRASGRGVVHTFTVIRDNKSMKGEPYVVAMIELEEGVRMMSNITDTHLDDVSIGMPVEVYFEPAADDVAIPLFRRSGPNRLDQLGGAPPSQTPRRAR
jgi:hypothetical protein